jgi:hypothetical protein
MRFYCLISNVMHDTSSVIPSHNYKTRSTLSECSGNESSILMYSLYADAIELNVIELIM